ncbi:MAG: exopolysaccharide biosynthesis protein [Devosia sp.]|jgi:hypothetical protein|uniref:exopolysaccharide biosynthesis protein n=1 Tax=unclassified Devosia TaxID=196773 RepID=UPI0019FF0111|nr:MULTISPECIES: exopolysaccharide biosynthesis protein [unclassified Devosia]MBF0680343.1 exopolysaccharide biosynthesis protein [Devosia sp.]WEJ32954.1 exopolysaccharide biosynthesis protein [Devosia sp. SD17-2]
MADAQQGTLTNLIDKVDEHARAGDGISIGLIQEIVGPRAAGPLLLIPALIVISPLSIIPGIPTLTGIHTVLVAGQIALGRKTMWLPKWLTERSIPGRHVEKLLKFLKPVGRVADTIIKPRARVLVAPPLRRAGAVICVLVGMIMPLLEFVPFTSTWAAAVIAVYAMAITAKDGFLALAWVGLVAAALSILLMLLV